MQRTIHVRPRSDGKWIVELEHSRVLLSTHDYPRDAMDAARHQARVHDADDIVVHDVYERARVLNRDQMPSGHVPSSGVRG